MRAPMPSDEAFEDGHWVPLSVADMTQLRLLYAMREG
jgi:hypothetical protein